MSDLAGKRKILFRGTRRRVSPARLDLVAPFSLTGFDISPARQFGSLVSAGTLTLSGPAADSTTVFLTSSNSAAATVPSSLTVPAGSNSFAFPIVLKQVTTNTPVTLTATLQGVTKTATLTALSPSVL